MLQSDLGRSGTVGPRLVLCECECYVLCKRETRNAAAGQRSVESWFLVDQLSGFYIIY